MKKIFSSQDPGVVHSLRMALESRGIDCEVRGINRRIGMGEIPPIECWPELWVLDESRIEEAEKIVADAAEPSTPGETWNCAKCGESVEVQFGACWKCGTARAAPPDA